MAQFGCRVLVTIVVLFMAANVQVYAWPGMGKSADAVAAHVANGVRTDSSSSSSDSFSSSSSSSFILNRMDRIAIRPRSDSNSFVPLATCANSCSNAGMCLTSSTGSSVCACNGGYFGSDCSQSFSTTSSTFFSATGLSKNHFFSFGLNSTSSTTPTVTIRFIIADPSNYFGLIWFPNKIDGMSGSSNPTGSGDCWIFGGVSTGSIVVSDRYSDGQNSPNIDSTQNLLNQITWSNSTHIYVEFTRKLNTGDTKDIIISSTPGTPLIFDWVVGNGAASNNDKLSGHDYAGAVGFVRVDFAGGSISVLSDGVEWPMLYTVFAIGGGITAALALVIQRDFVKRSFIGKILRKPIYYQEKALGCDFILADFLSSSLNLSISELFFTIAYVVCLIIGISLSSTQYNNQYRPLFYVIGHLASLHFSLALLPVTKQSIFLRIFGLDYDISIKWHRRCGRFGIFLAWIHGITQVICWNASILFSLNTLQYGLGPLFGFFSTISFSCLGCCAISYFRRNKYELFLYSHYLFFLLGLCLAGLHSINIRWLLIVPGSLWGIDLIYRFIFGYFLKPVNVLSVRGLKDENASIAISELTLSGVSGSFCLEAVAGDWVYLNVPSISLFQWHPFSISSITGEKAEKISLHILRMTGSSNGQEIEQTWTSKLFSKIQNAAVNYDNNNNNPEGRSGPKFPFSIFIHGPYRSFDLPIRSFPIVILVAGGIGITPIASLISDLTFRKQRNFSAPLKVYVIYVSKSLKCLTQWFAKQLSPLFTDENSYQLKLFYTGQNDVDIRAVNNAVALAASNSSSPSNMEQQIRARSQTASKKKSGTVVPANIFIHEPVEGKSNGENETPAAVDPSSPSSAPEVEMHVVNVSAYELAGRPSSNSEKNDINNNQMKINNNSNNPSSRPMTPAVAASLSDPLTAEDEKFSAERLSSTLLSRVTIGRPDVSVLFSSIRATSEGGSFHSSDVAVMACGPQSLVSSAHVAANRAGFAFHEEGFQY